MSNIIQITDLHLIENAAQTYKDVSPYNQLLKAIDSIEAHFPGEKIIIATGDLVSDMTPKTYDLLKDVFKKINAPVYVIPGNHDDAELVKQRLVAENISQEKEIYLNNWLIILLDSSAPGTVEHSGRLSEPELLRLQTLLSNNKDKNVIVAIHHPPLLFGAKFFQPMCLENRDEFNKIVQAEKNVKAVIFGHAHTQSVILAKGKLYICAPSTWRQVEHQIEGAHALNKMCGGYNWYKLNEDATLEFGTYYF